MKFLIGLYIFIIASLADAPGSQSYFIVWNIGQGQWITQVTPSRCSHFDFGGEIQYFQAIESRFHFLCSKKINELHLSHADLDHYAFLPLLLSRATKICWKIKPEDQRLLKFNSIPRCKNSSDQNGAGQNLFIECDRTNRNDCSTIFRNAEFLMPGDSPTKIEKIWIRFLTSPERIKVLILGHHGSATSTSPFLLKSLPRLHTTIASARFRVYGHPNKKVRERLKHFGLKVLKTESWGNIIFLQN